MTNNLLNYSKTDSKQHNQPTMSHWKEFKLGEIADINKKTIGKGYNFEIIEYVDTSSVTENAFDNPQVIPLAEAPSRAKRLVNEGDTIISTVRPIQKHYGYIKDAKPNTVVSTGFAVVSPKAIDPKFLFYFLTQEEITIYLNTLAESGTTTFPAFRPDELVNLTISAPESIADQTAIASILSSLDEKIELNNAINRNLEALAQALFKQWFVEFEFPNENGEPYKSSGGEMVESELGMIPKGWRVGKLGEVTTLIAGGDKPKNYAPTPDSKYKFPIYSNGISNDGLQGYTDKPRIFEESVTVSARGTIGYVSLRMQPYFPIVRLIAVIPNGSILSSKYLYQWLKNQNISGTGTTQQQLTVPDFSSFKILIPQIEIVIKYTLVMDSFFQTITSNIAENKSLSNLRDTLLPKLISGELEVNEALTQTEKLV